VIHSDSTKKEIQKRKKDTKTGPYYNGHIWPPLFVASLEN